MSLYNSFIIKGYFVPHPSFFATLSMIGRNISVIISTYEFKLCFSIFVISHKLDIYENQKEVKEKGITMSMSHKDTPVDNSPIEMFHSSLNSETFYLDRIHSTTNACVSRIIEEYIDYYNNIHIQTKLNNQSPVKYRQRLFK